MTRTRRGNPPFYEVFGVRYIVMTSSEGYKARGVASWYGKKFHGNPTSNGERYDMHRMTAAHKTLPLPTNVKVTNLSNGRSIIVRVNDRGPFVKNRLIDLSYAAAQELDMIGAGTAQVEVEALNTSYTGAITTASAVPTDKAATPIASTPEGLMYMQVGAFGEPDNAQTLARRLTDQGIAGVAVHGSNGETPALYRVRIGPFASIGDYDRVATQVASLDIKNTRLVVEDRGLTPLSADTP
jgi:rare lipoprotein A